MITVIEAAKQLGISPATVRQQIRNGALRAEKHGRDWFVTPLELRRYREQHLRPKETEEMA